jgi:hypothetical protein
LNDYIFESSDSIPLGGKFELFNESMLKKPTSDKKYEKELVDLWIWTFKHSMERVCKDPIKIADLAVENLKKQIASFK